MSSAVRPPSTSHPPSWTSNVVIPVQMRLAGESETGGIIFTRQLWQRAMPRGSCSEPVLNPTPNPRHSLNDATSSSSRRGSVIPGRSTSPNNKSPLTPEKSLPVRTTRKRTADSLGSGEEETGSTDTTPLHTRQNSGERRIQVCICQPSPRIPRPRNGTFHCCEVL